MLRKPNKEKPGKISDSVKTRTGKDKVSYNVGRKTGRVSQLSFPKKLAPKYR